jgi:hypothetical protein
MKNNFSNFCFPGCLKEFSRFSRSGCLEFLKSFITLWFIMVILFSVVFSVIHPCSFAFAQEKDWQFQLATGLGLGLQERKEYGSSTFSRYHPEWVAYGYLGGPMGPLWLRTGFRVAGLYEQPEMPQSARVEETDWSGAGELGVVWDSYLVPSLAVGGGLIRRKIEFVSRFPVEGSHKLDRVEHLPFLYAQLGLGIPFFRGFVVVEPYYRKTWVKADARTGDTLGAEMTFQIF